MTTITPNSRPLPTDPPACHQRALDPVARTAASVGRGETCHPSHEAARGSDGEYRDAGPGDSSPGGGVGLEALCQDGVHGEGGRDRVGVHAGSRPGVADPRGASDSGQLDSSAPDRAAETGASRAKPLTTARQREILRFFDRREVDGISPTVREVCAAFEFTSTNAAQDHLRRLETKGLIERYSATARSVQLTRKGLAEIGEKPPRRPAQLERAAHAALEWLAHHGASGAGAEDEPGLTELRGLLIDALGLEAA